MSVEIISHNNKKILYADNRGLTGQCLIDNMKSVNKKARELGYDILILADFRDACISKECVKYLESDEAKEAAKRYAKQAILGVTGIKKAIVNIYNSITGSNTKIFNSIDEAKNYLVSE